MSAIAWSDIRAITDNLGVQLDRINLAFGVGTETDVFTAGKLVSGRDSISKGAKTNLGRIQTLAGTNAEAGADMLQSFLQHFTKLSQSSADLYQLLRVQVDSLVSHVQSRGGSNNTFDLQAAAAGERFSPSFAELYRALGNVLSYLHVFPPVTQMASFAVSGAGAGVFTDGSDIDTDLYSAIDIEAKATTTCTAIGITAAVVDEDGTVTTATGTLNGASGTTVNLTVTSGKQITSITGITITGGAASEAFIIQSKADRVPAE